jgi:sugar lactone lactonase YvrE
MSSASIKKWNVTEPYLNIHCRLGEAPYYEAATNTLRFVDIKKKQMHTVDLTSGPASLRTLQFEMPVGLRLILKAWIVKRRFWWGERVGCIFWTGKRGRLHC